MHQFTPKCTPVDFLSRAIALVSPHPPVMILNRSCWGGLFNRERRTARTFHCLFYGSSSIFRKSNGVTSGELALKMRTGKFVLPLEKFSTFYQRSSVVLSSSAIIILFDLERKGLNDLALQNCLLFSESSKKSQVVEVAHAKCHCLPTFPLIQSLGPQIYGCVII